MKRYPNLFKPIKIGSLILRNRIESAPMGATLTPDSYLTRDTTAFYEMRAKGGAAIVTLGESVVDSRFGKAHKRTKALDDPGLLPSLIDTTDSIRRHGAVSSIELIHSGQRSNPNYTEDRKVYGPTAGESIYGGPILEMDEAMINQVVESFGDAAEMAKLGGVDMCMVHGGHGWLLAQFLSPINNKRTDNYGGSLENRARLSLMVIENIRKKCGPDFPIEFRLSGDEFIEGGFNLEEAIEFAKLIDEKVDLIHVSATTFHNPDAAQRMFPNMFLPRGCNVFLAAAIKKVVKTPVVTVGALNDPADMEEIISSGQADMVSLGRALYADPFLPQKAKLGNEQDITPCLRCNLCLSGSFVPYVKYSTEVARCTVNPKVGREFDDKFVQTSSGRKKVLIAGGGPGGMQAAITAADRGHDVILYEKSDSLGGALKIPTNVSFKKDLKKFMECLITRVNNRAINVFLNIELSPEIINKINPDVLIVSIGAESIVPPIEGIGNKNVLMAKDIHKNMDKIGEKVVVIGGGLTGCEEGLDLAYKGKDVTIIEMKDALATNAPFLHWRGLMLELDKNLKFKMNTKCKLITEKGVLITDLDDNEEIIEADTVIISAGLKSKTNLVEKLINSISDTCDYYIIGDCKKPDTVKGAIHSGYFTAMNI